MYQYIVSKQRTLSRCGAALLLLVVPLVPIKAAGVKNSTKVTDAVFVAFDTETTGFSPASERIVEIGAVRFSGTNVIDKQQWLINPNRKIPFQASRVHGIYASTVRNSPSFEEVYPEFVEFCEGAILLAHNARFDVDFVSEEITRHQQPVMSNTVVDSLALFRSWFPDAPSHSIQALADYLDLDDGGYHRALADSDYIVRIFEVGLKRQKKGLTLKKMVDQAGGVLHFRDTTQDP